MCSGSEAGSYFRLIDFVWQIAGEQRDGGRPHPLRGRRRVLVHRSGALESYKQVYEP